MHRGARVTPEVLYIVPCLDVSLAHAIQYSLRFKTKKATTAVMQWLSVFVTPFVWFAESKGYHRGMNCDAVGGPTGNECFGC